MLRTLKTTAGRLGKDEGGASLLEYTILLALITTACVAVISAIGGDVLARWQAMSAALGIGG